MLRYNPAMSGNYFGRFLDKIKANRLLPIMAAIIAIEIIVELIAFEGKWFYLNGYGPLSVQDVRDIVNAKMEFGFNSEILYNQAFGPTFTNAILLFSVPTLLFILWGKNVITVLGLSAMGIFNLVQLYSYLSDTQKVSGVFILLVVFSICTLVLIIVLFARLIRQIAPKKAINKGALVLVIGAAGMVSCSENSKNSNDYMYFPVKYQGFKAYMSPDGKISAMAEKDVFGNNVIRTTAGISIPLEGKALRLGMKDAVVIRDFWDGKEFVVKIKKGENKVEQLFETESTTLMGNYFDGVVPVAFQDQENHILSLRIMNTKGDVVAEISDIDGDEVLTSSKFFSNGLLRVKTRSKKTAYLDTNGNVAIPPRDYFKADDFYNGHALVAESPDLWFLIDTKGDIIQRYDNVKPSHLLTPGGIFFLKNRSIYYDDLNGNHYELPESQDVVGLRDSYFVYRDYHGFGISNYKGEVLLSPIDVRMMLPASEEAVVVRHQNGDTEMLSLTGESVKKLGQSDGLYSTPVVYGHKNDFGFWIERDGDLYYYTQQGDQPLSEPILPMFDDSDYKSCTEDLRIRR